MTADEIKAILEGVATNQAALTQNQAQTDARLQSLLESQQATDKRLQTLIDGQAQNEAAIATLIKSQNRYDQRQTRLDEILHHLADKATQTDERFAELAKVQVKFDGRLELLETYFEMLTNLTKITREETNGRFEAIDQRLDALITSVANLTDQVTKLVTAWGQHNGDAEGRNHNP
jgi:chromosome segregation ATPase